MDKTKKRIPETIVINFFPGFVCVLTDIAYAEFDKAISGGIDGPICCDIAIRIQAGAMETVKTKQVTATDQPHQPG